MPYPESMLNLIEQFAKLPGVGKRTAERFSLYILSAPHEQVEVLSKLLLKVNESIHTCRQCFNLSEEDICLICSDPTRDHSVICVVQDPKDVIAIERSGSYKGAYHVLLGTIAPQDDRGPEDLKIPGLIERIKKEGIKEVIIATDSDNEGEITALYLTKVLKPLNVPLSRIGIGIPAGSSLEYVDISTLSMSLTSRREIKA